MTETEYDAIVATMPDAMNGFVKSWGLRQFADKVHAAMAGALAEQIDRLCNGLEQYRDGTGSWSAADDEELAAARALIEGLEAGATAPAVATGSTEANLRRALQFYANGEHFGRSDESAWDTVSGEPQNYWCDEAGTATVEDGTIAKYALAGRPLGFEDDAVAAPDAVAPQDFEAWAKGEGLICEHFGIRGENSMLPLIRKAWEAGRQQPAAVAGPAWDKTRDSLSMLMMGFASNPARSIQAACAALDSATEPGMPLTYLRGAAPALEAPAAPDTPWCPDVCPITGRPFFMWLNHWQTGKSVPTYGGPFDSYTLPVKGSDGVFECERYDHDAGEWMTEGMGWCDLSAKLVDDQAFVVAPDHPRYNEIEAFAAAAPQAPAAPSPKPLTTEQDVVGYLDARLWEFIDMAAAVPSAKPDPRIWPHLLVYAPSHIKQRLTALFRATKVQAAPAAPAVDASDDKALLDFLRDSSCDLRSIDVPTGGDDSDVHWRVIEHYMSEPREREIGRSWSDDPREAIRAAIAAQAAAKGENGNG